MSSRASQSIGVVSLGHILFPKARTHIDAGLLEFRDRIEQGHSFMRTLLADTS